VLCFQKSVINLGASQTTFYACADPLRDEVDCLSFTVKLPDVLTQCVLQIHAASQFDGLHCPTRERYVLTSQDHAARHSADKNQAYGRLD